MSDQRWLSLDGICNVLGMSPRNVQWLARNGHLVVMKGWNSAGTRYLDPTPEYANKLKMAEALYGRKFPIPPQLEKVPMLTLREVGDIMGWTPKGGYNAVQKGRLSGGVLVGKYKLYSIENVRKMLWKRQDRTKAHQRAPFLIKHLVAFFLKQQADANQDIPTDTEFAEDDALQRRMVRLTKMPERERDAALAEFVQKVGLSKEFATILLNHSCSHCRKASLAEEQSKESAS